MIGRGGMGSVWQAIHLALDNLARSSSSKGELAERRRGARALRARGEGGGAAPEPARRADHRPRRLAGHALHRDGAPRGRGPRQARSPRPAGKLPPAQVNSDHPAGLSRALARRTRRASSIATSSPTTSSSSTTTTAEIVKILDFGIAKQTSQAIDGSNTKTGAMLGHALLHEPGAGAGHQERRLAERSLVARGHRVTSASPGGCRSRARRSAICS